MQYKSLRALKDLIISNADIMKLKTKEQHHCFLTQEGAEEFF